MNIFVLDEDPHQAAKYHCNTHVVKMIIESAQMLSTAHRLLDGHQIIVNRGRPWGRTRNTKRWVFRNDNFKNRTFYQVAHVHHPCTVWTAASCDNYDWHYELFSGLCSEYRVRYPNGSHRTVRRIADKLRPFPKNIPYGPRTAFPLAMPDKYKTDDPVESYRNFYIGEKMGFAKWTTRSMPYWIEERELGHDVDLCPR